VPCRLDGAALSLLRIQGGREVSAGKLDNLAAYCEARVDDQSIPVAERRLWLQIANEISNYLEPAPDALADHLELFT
jgi:hypothetical protein